MPAILQCISKQDGPVSARTVGAEATTWPCPCPSASADTLSPDLRLRSRLNSSVGLLKLLQKLLEVQCQLPGQLLAA